MLECLVLRRVRLPFRTPHREVRPQQRLAERGSEDGVGLESIQRLRLRLGEPDDPALVPLPVLERRRVDVDRVGKLEPALDPVEARGDDPTERQVRVAARIRRLQLDVRGRLLDPAES